jgi:hypothetical protein
VRWAIASRRGWEDAGAVLPEDVLEMVTTMLNTRALNNWLHTAYSLEDVAGMNWLVMDLLSALNAGLFPDKKER